ncbi:MAG: HAD-IIA family hydrolase [Anaerolineaceae bacterium]|nr:HAD-IIA family hydrolase [Anaerolineaceae bacterium]
MPFKIEGISSDIKSMMFDMDGVIWKSNTPTGDLSYFFSTLQKNNIQYGFITNNATKPIDIVQKRLASFGVYCEKEFIINSAIATAALLKERFPNGGNLYIVGEEGLISTLAEAGYTHQNNPTEDTLAVVAGLDHGVNYQKLSTAASLIRKGAPFYGSNGDKTFPTPLGEVPGAGTILAAIAAASGVDPIIAGKPQPFLLDLMIERMQTNHENTLMIGDRLETDILGGNNAGCPTLLVLSGVSTRKNIEEMNILPSIIREDIFELLTEFNNE